jgi:hypothetical protein
MRLRRTLSYLALDDNPLRRRVDRVEARVTIVLIGLFLSVGPVVAWRTGEAVHRSDLQAARIEQRDIVRTNAVLQADAVATPSAPDGTELGYKAIGARWIAPDGAAHVGMILPDGAATAGSVIPVWIDAKGDLSPAPRTDSDAEQDGISAGLVALLAVFGVCAGLWLILRWLVERHRMAWWEGEWTWIGPRWTGGR